jgi:uncharacterized protein (DUF1499 family)
MDRASLQGRDKRSPRNRTAGSKTPLVFLASVMWLLGQVPLSGLAMAAPELPTAAGAGYLAPCPDKPNCVNSLATDTRHAIAPLQYVGSGAAAMVRLRAIVVGMPRTTLLVDRPDYLHVAFRSRVFRFVDDVEFLLDGTEAVIHVRSASRLGHGDFGVNRDRVETIRADFVPEAGAPTGR